MNGRLARRRVTIRPMTTADAAALDQVFAGMSAASRRARYLVDLDELPAASRTALLAIDGIRQVAFVAEVRHRRRTIPVGIARYVVDGHDEAEIAYEVVDAWHGRSVGRRLLRRLVAAARAAGIERLRATVSNDNIASIGLLRTELASVRVRRDGTLLEVSAYVGGASLQARDLVGQLQPAVGISS